MLECRITCDIADIVVGSRFQRTLADRAGDPHLGRERHAQSDLSHRGQHRVHHLLVLQRAITPSAAAEHADHAAHLHHTNIADLAAVRADQRARHAAGRLLSKQQQRQCCEHVRRRQLLIQCQRDCCCCCCAKRGCECGRQTVRDHQAGVRDERVRVVLLIVVESARGDVAARRPHRQIEDFRHSRLHIASKSKHSLHRLFRFCNNANNNNNKKPSQKAARVRAA